MHTRSPTAKPVWVNKASWAVANTSGNPPALGQVTDSGTGMASGSSTRHRSACPPPCTTAITRSPFENRWQFGPAATTSPAISSPPVAGAPGGGG